MTAESLRPVTSPIRAIVKQIMVNECAKPKTIHATVNGIATNMIVVRRPILSLSVPLNELPIGFTIAAILAVQ